MDRLDQLASSARIVSSGWGKPFLSKHSQPTKTYELSDELISYDFTDIVSSGTGTDEDCLPFVATPLLVAIPEPSFPFPLLPANSVRPPPTPIPVPTPPK